MTEGNLLEKAKQGDAQAIAVLMNRQLQPKGITVKTALKDGCLQVMLESPKVPSQNALVGWVRKSMTSLGAAPIKKIKVYGRQIGNEFPAWSEEFNIPPQPLSVSDPTDSQSVSSKVSTTRKQLTLEERAREGDSEAITLLLNRALADNSMRAKASLTNKKLQVMVESAEIPEETIAVELIGKELENLNLKDIEIVNIYGRELGDDFPAWSQNLKINQEEVSTSTSNSESKISSNQERDSSEASLGIDDKKSVADKEVNDRNRSHYEIAGVGESLRLTRTRVIITPKGLMGFASKGLKGSKEIPISRITAIQFKPAGGLFNGYIQFSLMGSNEAKGGLLEASKDENTVMFTSDQQPNFYEAKQYIDSVIDGESIDFYRLNILEEPNINTTRSNNLSNSNQEKNASLSNSITPSWNCVYTFKNPNSLAWVTSLDINYDGEIVVIGYQDCTIKLWHLKRREEICTLTGHSKSIRAVTFSPDGRMVVSGSDDKQIKIWDVETGKIIYTLTGHSKAVTAVAFSPNGETLVTGSDDCTIKLWSLKTKKEQQTLSGHSGYVQSVDVSPDGETVVSGGCDFNVKIWKIKEGRVLNLSSHKGFIQSVKVSPDGQTIASGGFDDAIKLWNLTNGEPIRTLSGQPGRSEGVQCVAFSPDGALLATASGSHKTIKLWDWLNGELFCTLSDHIKGVYAVSFTPDSKTLISGSRDQTIKVWQAE
ncbi:DUF4429 domain-containing protein [Laspinema palackyanum]|uniref:WD40 domain-containing protein n=1 Tax=Laspinema palackyanum TaxID=3231601 RepID=UPI00345D7816|nr:DUF4429 domain-containing protein [Laspinema sp. D2c]